MTTEETLRAINGELIDIIASLRGEIRQMKAKAEAQWSHEEIVRIITNAVQPAPAQTEINRINSKRTHEQERINRESAAESYWRLNDKLIVQFGDAFVKGQFAIVLNRLWDALGQPSRPANGDLAP